MLPPAKVTVFAAYIIHINLHSAKLLVVVLKLMYTIGIGLLHFCFHVASYEGN